MNLKKLIPVIFFICFSSIILAQNKIIINADLGKEKINKHIYGHFSEHLGNCIYGGYWVGEDSNIPNTNTYFQPFCGLSCFYRIMHKALFFQKLSFFSSIYFWSYFILKARPLQAHNLILHQQNLIHCSRDTNFQSLEIYRLLMMWVESFKL